jgi:putative alpha-1,2-mannosidase
MSAWYVFSALGFYPVCPGQPIYVIGSPLFEKATIRLDNGKKFVVESINNSEKNLYIQTATLNGKEYNKTWLKHSDILKGGNLVFIMGPEPNNRWGSQPENYPPSGMEYKE